MKSLRVFAFGLAIGVLAILGSAPSASAAVGARHRHLPRAHRFGHATPGTRLSRAPQSTPDPSRRSGPRHPIRAAQRPVSHQARGRGYGGGQTAALTSIQDNHLQMISWRIGASESISHNYMDDHVISGRGPPPAGPQLYASRACHPKRRCVPCPVADSQVVLFLRTPAPKLQTQLSSSNSSPNRLSPEGLFGPPRAVRYEGTAARLHSPSLGELA
jgi:hypothetical protein